MCYCAGHGTPRALARFLGHLAKAYKSASGSGEYLCLLFLAYQSTKESEMQIVISGAISHNTAVSMLDQTSDCGARDFMNSLVSAAEHKQPSEYNGVM